MESLHSHNGFTLIELMVVLAIIGVITMVTLNSQSSFNKTLILSNTAYDIALTLRSAETFGIGSRASGGIANAGYGVHFQTGNTITLFADVYPPVGSPGLCHTPPINDPTGPDARPGDCIYEASYGTNQSEKVNDYTLGNGIFVKDLCAATCGLSSLDIVFARPNPDAFISTNGSYSSSNTSACLVVASPSAPSGPFRYIKIESSGAITANATQCP